MRSFTHALPVIFMIGSLAFAGPIPRCDDELTRHLDHNTDATRTNKHTAADTFAAMHDSKPPAGDLGLRFGDYSGHKAGTSNSTTMNPPVGAGRHTGVGRAGGPDANHSGVSVGTHGRAGRKSNAEVGAASGSDRVGSGHGITTGVRTGETAGTWSDGGKLSKAGAAPVAGGAQAHSGPGPMKADHERPYGGQPDTAVDHETSSTGYTRFGSGTSAPGVAVVVPVVYIPAMGNSDSGAGGKSDPIPSGTDGLNLGANVGRTANPNNIASNTDNARTPSNTESASGSTTTAASGMTIPTNGANGGSSTNGVTDDPPLSIPDILNTGLGAVRYGQNRVAAELGGYAAGASAGGPVGPTNIPSNTDSANSAISASTMLLPANGANQGSVTNGITDGVRMPIQDISDISSGRVATGSGRNDIDASLSMSSDSTDVPSNTIGASSGTTATSTGSTINAIEGSSTNRITSGRPISVSDILNPSFSRIRYSQNRVAAGSGEYPVDANVGVSADPTNTASTADSVSTASSPTSTEGTAVSIPDVGAGSVINEVKDGLHALIPDDLNTGSSSIQDQVAGGSGEYIVGASTRMLTNPTNTPGNTDGANSAISTTSTTLPPTNGADQGSVTNGVIDGVRISDILSAGSSGINRDQNQVAPGSDEHAVDASGGLPTNTTSNAGTMGSTILTDTMVPTSIANDSNGYGTNGVTDGVRLSALNTLNPGSSGIRSSNELGGNNVDASGRVSADPTNMAGSTGTASASFTSTPTVVPADGAIKGSATNGVTDGGRVSTLNNAINVDSGRMPYNQDGAAAGLNGYTTDTMLGASADRTNTNSSTDSMSSTTIVPTGNEIPGVSA